MKRLKKTLALLLVMVMALGIAPMMASAITTSADYSDGASITYKEAVDVLSAVRVFEGEPDGSFAPGRNVTRAEAAAIIARLMLRRSVADSLPAATTIFRDVPSSHWASGYISYCVTQGIVAGYGDGNFGPGDPVTASQFSAMILRAVGFGKQGEYNGPSWETNAIVDGMFWGVLNTNVDYTKPATRQETAQYAFRALGVDTQLRYVSWDTNRGDYSPQELPATVSIFNRVYQPTFVGLAHRTVRDDFGRPGREWSLLADEIGTYIRNPALTFTARTTRAAMETALDRYTLLQNVFNAAGTEVTTWNRFDTICGALIDSVFHTTNNIADATGNGIVVEIYANALREVSHIAVIRTDIVTVTAKNTAAKTVTLARKAGSNADAGISGLTPPMLPFGGAINFVIGETGVNKDFYAEVKDLDLNTPILMSPIYKVLDDEWVVGALAYPTTAKGVITSSTATTLNIGTTQYARAAIRSNDGANAVAGRDEATLFLDEYGYVVDVTWVAPPARNFIMIIRAYYAVNDDGEQMPMLFGLLPNGDEIRLRTPGADLVAYTDGARLYRIEPRNTDGSYPVTLVNSNQDTPNQVTWIEGLNTLWTTATVRFGTQNAGAGLPFASDVKFFYFPTGQNGVYSVVNGMHRTTIPTNGYAMVENRGTTASPRWVITAVYSPESSPAPSDPARMFYIATTTSVDRLLVNNDPIPVYRAYRNGVMEKTIADQNGIATRDTVAATGFYNFTERTDDTYRVAPFIPTTTTGWIIEESIDFASRDGGFIEVDGVELRLTSSTVYGDCRSVTMPNQTVRAIELSTAGIFNAYLTAGQFTDIQVSVLYSIETGAVLLLYITQTTQP